MVDLARTDCRVRFGARALFGVTVAALLLAATQARGEPVGAIAALDGTAEIGRGAAWRPAALADTLEIGDQVRTARPGRVRIVFADESVLELADASQITIDESVFDPAPGAARAAVNLLSGKIRALVSEYYRTPGNSYEVRTETAVAGVRGTTFVVTYDADADRTDIVGVEGWVEVHNAADRGAPGVRLTTGELSVVLSGLPPSPARRLDDVMFRQYLEGFTFIGAGRPESLVIDHPLVTGTTVPEVDRIAALPIPAIQRFTLPGDLPLPDAGSVAGQPLPIIDAAGRLRIRLF
jgi:ferric-dicitrate binding protein FerR (iron transport regulator)